MWVHDSVEFRERTGPSFEVQSNAIVVIDTQIFINATS